MAELLSWGCGCGVSGSSLDLPDEVSSGDRESKDRGGIEGACVSTAEEV